MVVDHYFIDNEPWIIFFWMNFCQNIGPGSKEWALELIFVCTAGTGWCFPGKKPISRQVLCFQKGFSHGNTKSIFERKIKETCNVFLRSLHR